MGYSTKSLRQRLVVRIFILLCVLIVPLTSIAHAQNSSITISLAVPDYDVGTAFTDELLADFEAEHPNIKVNLVKATNTDLVYPSAAVDINKYLDGVDRYAQMADVLWVGSYNLNIEATRAHAFLNLTPLMDADSQLNATAFIPSVIKAFQWDQGTWALPATADLIVLSYLPKAFDQAGLTYPNDRWTINDFAQAARALAQKDKDGNVLVPGLYVSNSALLFRTLINHSFYDDSMLPEAPDIAQSALAPILDTWTPLITEGVVGSAYDAYEQIPMRLDSAGYTFSTNVKRQGTRRVGAFLPGGYTEVDAQGFAISAGTAFPEAAYALAKFLISNKRVIYNFYGVAPALRAITNDNAPVDGLFSRFLSEDQAFISKAFVTALPASEVRYGNYISKAVQDMRTTKIDGHTALQQAQNNAMMALESASSRRQSHPLMVATPIPTPNSVLGKVTLKFHISSFANPLPNSALWESKAQSFVDADPQVNRILIDTTFESSIAKLTQNYDCFYQPYNLVSPDSIPFLLNLDPLMDVDPAFSKDDLFSSVLNQLRYADKIWGYPVDLQPQVLFYNRTLFTKLNVAVPQNGWTTESFIQTLRVLKSQDNGRPPLAVRSFRGNYLLMLIASYGGVPLDYRTVPPTVHFTTPQTVTAIKQVLDLAKAGYINYQELTGTSSSIPNSNDAPLRTDALNIFSVNSVALKTTMQSTDYHVVSYPVGDSLVPMSYDIGTAYIGAKSANPEACYRWISFFSHDPTLLTAMPARYSILEDPALRATHSTDDITLYEYWYAASKHQTLIVLPSQFSALQHPEQLILEYWLNRALDHYVLQNMSLDTELSQAEDLAKAYLQCVSTKTTGSADANSTAQLSTPYIDCATTLDPSVKSLLPG